CSRTTSGRSSERSLDDLELVAEHGGHVESNLRRPHPRFLDPARRQMANALTLVVVDGFGRRSEQRRRPRLHLAEHDLGATLDDEVELATPTAPVPGDQLVALRLVPGRGDLLPGEGTPAALGRHQSSFLGSSSMFTSLNVTTLTEETKRLCRY